MSNPQSLTETPVMVAEEEEYIVTQPTAEKPYPHDQHGEPASWSNSQTPPPVPANPLPKFKLGDKVLNQYSERPLTVLGMKFEADINEDAKEGFDTENHVWKYQLFRWRGKQYTGKDMTWTSYHWDEYGWLEEAVILKALADNIDKAGELGLTIPPQ